MIHSYQFYSVVLAKELTLNEMIDINNQLNSENLRLHNRLENYRIICTYPSLAKIFELNDKKYLCFAASLFTSRLQNFKDFKFYSNDIFLLAGMKSEVFLIEMDSVKSTRIPDEIEQEIQNQFMLQKSFHQEFLETQFLELEDMNQANFE